MNRCPSDSSSVDRLLDQAGAGDDRAVEQLMERFRLDLRQYVDLRLEGRIRQRVDPSDVVQDTFVALLPQVQEFCVRRPMPFRIWLRKMAAERLRAIRKTHRSRRRTVNREADVPDRSSLAVARQFLALGHSPGHQVVQQERHDAVAEAIAKLAEVDRELLLMRNVENLTYDEIGYSLEITPAAARKRYGRALLRLQKRLSKLGFGDSFP